MRSDEKDCCILQRRRWGLRCGVVDYRALVLVAICLALVQTHELEAHALSQKRMQRRFMWKQMDETVDDFMDGVASGARAMRNMIGDLLPSPHPTKATVRHVSSHDYLPSESTRVKYIIRSPSGKPLKVMKMHPSKKRVNVKIVTVPKPIMDGKFPKPKLRFPSSEELRKLEREQELMVEGRVPMKTTAELMAEIESEKKFNEFAKENKFEKEKKYDDFEKGNNFDEFEDYKPHPEDTEGADEADRGTDDIIKGHIPEFSDDWMPVRKAPHQMQERQPKEKTQAPAPFVTKKPFATSKPFAMSHLHTSIVSEPEKGEHGSEEYERPRDRHNTYEVTEHSAEESAEESVALPLTQVRDPPPPHSTAGATVTTTEEPNYPAAFLRRFRERTAAAVSAHGTSRFRPSTIALDTSWVPSARNESFGPAAKDKAQQAGGGRWPSGVAEHTAESVKHSRIESTPVTKPESEQHPAPAVARLTTHQKTKPAATGEESKPRESRQRGRVRFGDKLRADDF